MMKKIVFILLLLLVSDKYSYARTTRSSVALFTGMYPTMGGNLHSAAQSDLLGINNGIADINRYTHGIDNERIDKLTGFAVGTEFRALIYNLLLFKAGINYSTSLLGGTGTSTDLLGNSLKVHYSMWTIDTPFLVGISYPFGERIRLSFCSGLALAYGSYSNSFKSATVNSSATFSGWAIPLCVSFGGEYILNNNIALISSITYYKGRSGTIKDKSDYASINFSGYRWQLGAAYYFTTVTSKKI